MIKKPLELILVSFSCVAAFAWAIFWGYVSWIAATFEPLQRELPIAVILLLIGLLVTRKHHLQLMGGFGLAFLLCLILAFRVGQELPMYSSAPWPLIALFAERMTIVEIAIRAQVPRIWFDVLFLYFVLPLIAIADTFFAGFKLAAHRSREQRNK